MSNGGMVGAGILLILLGFILISGILAFLLKVIGTVALIAGIIVGVIGLVGMIRGKESAY